LAACAPKTETPTATPQPTATKAATAPTATTAAAEGECKMDWNPTFPTAPKVYDPPVEIKVIWPAGRKWLEGTDDGHFNNPLYNQCLEGTHVRFTLHWEAAGDVTASKLAADLAAGTPPDMHFSQGPFLEQLIADGAIENIKDIWEATASPLLKKMKQYPDHNMWIPALRGDKLWGIAWINGPAYNVDNLCYVRQDWLDKLGMEMPTTLDEWTEMFKRWQSEGLSKWGLGACKNLATWFYSLDPIFGAFGVMPQAWRPAGDGTLYYDSISPGIKEALGQLRSWYEEGFLNPDYYTLGEGQDEENVLNNNHGAYTAPWWVGGGHADWETKTYVDTGMKWAIMPYPKGPRGEQGRMASAAVEGRVIWFKKGIDPIKVEAFINNMNWHMEKHVNWEKYQQYGEWRNSHAFVEGYEWEWDENCELIEGPVKNTYAYMNVIDGGFPYMCYPSYQYDIFHDMKKWVEADPATLNKAQRWLIGKPEVLKEMEYYSSVYETAGVQIPNEYFGNPTQLMLETLPDLNTLEATVFNEIVIGDRDLDEFDDFVEEWKSTGGDDVTRDVSNWYAETFG
jgi:putative aldouronate transport system substrate-binding protein